MQPFCLIPGLYTDYYQLTMAQGYFRAGMADSVASFDYFFRANPFGGGYTIFAGLEDALDALEGLRFGPEGIAFLEKQGFHRDFLDRLAKFRFRGNAMAMREGEVVFPMEPLMRVTARVMEAQIVETVLLNLLNFETLIATKASRVVQAAAGRPVSDFGLRRAQGLAGIHASRGAAIGGVASTSNVEAALRYDLDPAGTMAHSWVQSFPDELAAFRKYVEVFPEDSILLVDTYNTLRSGIPNSITVAREMERDGKRLSGIRLDSGDLAWLSTQARARLDAAGLPYVKIVASNRLDEYLVRSLVSQGAAIDAFGVGTALVTGASDSALDGIYKLCEIDGSPRLKVSEFEAKTTLPGLKKVIRYTNGDGRFTADAIVCDDETDPGEFEHPLFPHRRSRFDIAHGKSLLEPVMKEGRRLNPPKSTREIARFAKERQNLLAPEFCRFENPHVYRVGISAKLAALRARLLEQAQAKLPPI